MTNWERLADAVRQRIVELSINAAELARRAGVSAAYISVMLSGTEKTYRTMDAAKVSAALGWTPDSVQRVLRGEEPELVAPAHEALKALLDRVETMMAEVGPNGEPAVGIDATGLLAGRTPKVFFRPRESESPTDPSSPAGSPVAYKLEDRVKSLSEDDKALVEAYLDGLNARSRSAAGERKADRR